MRPCENAARARLKTGLWQQLLLTTARAVCAKLSWRQQDGLRYRKRFTEGTNDYAGGYDIRGTRQQDLVVQKLSNSTTLAKKPEVNIPPANRCQAPRRTCRAAFYLAAFLELRVLDAGVHCDGRRADVTRTEAQLRVFLVSPVTPAMRRRWRFLARPRLRPQRPRGAHGSSLAFEGCPRPGMLCGRCAGMPASADLWCADLALNARAPLRQQPFIGLDIR